MSGGMHTTADTVASVRQACGACHRTDPQRRPFRSAQRSGFGAATADPPRRFTLIHSSAPDGTAASRSLRWQCSDSAVESDGRAADDACAAVPFGTSRRTALFGAVGAAAAAGWLPSPAQAVQGLTAGRVPGERSCSLTETRVCWAETS